MDKNEKIFPIYIILIFTIFYIIKKKIFSNENMKNYEFF